VALHVLEDLGFYCVDNIPAPLLGSLVEELLSRGDSSHDLVGVGIDARNRPADLEEIPGLVTKLRADGVSCDVVFLLADDNVLLKRFSETRRKHPLTDGRTGLAAAITRERQVLGPIINTADLIIDTTSTNIYTLAEHIQKRVGIRERGALSVQIESFGYKHGLPANADFVFDVRCLPNPYWEPNLRALNGKDDLVIEFLDNQPRVQEMIDDIVRFLEHWIPRYENFQRSYLTVAIGCTGGQHRSVYVAEAVAARLRVNDRIIGTRHNELPEPASPSE
jgi:UPF0042 nucleotide-binding protein